MVFSSFTCGSWYAPGASKVGSVRRRKPSISISAVGPPIRVMEMGMMNLPYDAAFDGSNFDESDFAGRVTR